MKIIDKLKEGLAGIRGEQKLLCKSRVNEFVFALGRGEEPIGVGTRIITDLETHIAELEAKVFKYLDSMSICSGPCGYGFPDEIEDFMQKHPLGERLELEQ